MFDAAAVREAYAEAKERLDGYARSAQPDAVAAVADDLLAVARLLRREPRLRRALVDPSRSADARVELLRSLLGGKVGDEALTVVEALVRGRWSAPGELLDATERIGAEALFASAERAGDLGEVEDELFRFSQLVAGDYPLATALGDPTVEEQRKTALVHDLLDGKANPVTVRLVELAVGGFGGRSFEGSLTRLVELVALRRELELAYVTAAVLPTEAEEQRLVELLSRMYGRNVSLKVEVKPEVIGGMSVRVGADLYDGTVLRRLTEARQALTK
jgi:F-type H+-transporting ATPase subunit delta